MNEQEWIENQEDCCIPDCENSAKVVDNMGNVFCLECAYKNQEEEPENWE